MYKTPEVFFILLPLFLEDCGGIAVLRLTSGVKLITNRKYVSLVVHFCPHVFRFFFQYTLFSRYINLYATVWDPTGWHCFTEFCKVNKAANVTGYCYITRSANRLENINFCDRTGRQKISILLLCVYAVLVRHTNTNIYCYFYFIATRVNIKPWGDLRIDKTLAADQGIYTCVAKSSTERISSFAFLSILSSKSNLIKLNYYL